MAMQKKKSPRKPSVKVVKKKPTSALAKTKKKAVVKKAVVKKPVAMSAPQKKPVVVVKRRWFSFFRTTAMILVLATGAAAVTVNPALYQQFKASILAQVSAPGEETTMENLTEGKGVLLSYENGGENEQKLLDIFKTVFPETSIEEVQYDSEAGKQLVSQLGVYEVPNIYFEKEAFESEKLSEVVKDLFTLQGNYYGLNVSLVNPSHQVKIQGSLTTEGGIWIGEKEAPITVYVYSDVKCQHCRVNERNNTAEWKKLVDEGLVQIVYLDLPQNAESTFHSTALNCFFDQKSDAVAYLELREKIFARPNLTKAYVTREMQKSDADYDQCDEAAYRELFRTRLKTADAEGVTGVPTLYIGSTGGDKFMRFTGAKEFSEYEQALDELLGQSSGTVSDQ
jgi:protein-disulfide isomerase